MPVASFILGATGWSILDHKPQVSRREGDPRHVPVGVLHALDPEDHTAICSGETMEADPSNRSFHPWGAGTCAACSEQLAPRQPSVEP